MSEQGDWRASTRGVGAPRGLRRAGRRAAGGARVHPLSERLRSPPPLLLSFAFSFLNPPSPTPDCLPSTASFTNHECNPPPPPACLPGPPARTWTDWTRCCPLCRCPRACPWPPWPLATLPTPACWPSASSPPATPRCWTRCSRTRWVGDRGGTGDRGDRGGRSGWQGGAGCCGVVERCAGYLGGKGRGGVGGKRFAVALQGADRCVCPACALFRGCSHLRTA